MTVEIETPQGLRTGSGVLEVQLRENSFLAPGPSAYFELRGQTVPIDLPGGQTIYALLSTPRDADFALNLPLRAFRKRFPEMNGTAQASSSAAERVEFLRNRRPTATLEGEEVPMLVRFGNPADPRSVATVGVGPAGEIAPGIRLRRVLIEISEDAVTEGIERRLPWVTNLNGSLSQNTTRHPGNPAGDMPAYAFTRGIF